MYQSSRMDDNLIKNNIMNPEINKLQEFQKMILEDDSQIKEIVRKNSSFENEDFSVNLNDLKSILNEITNYYQVNLETILESFLVKFRDIEIISFTDFISYFLENLESQEKILSALYVNNSLDLNNQNFFNGDLSDNYIGNMSLDNSLNNPTLKKDDFDYQENKINSINLQNLNETDNIFLMILHRSLYILKKKFEINSDQIKKINEEHLEKNKLNKIINVDNFISVLDKVFKTCKINFLDLKQPSDLFKAEIIEDYSDEKLNMIEKQIKNFMLNNRKFYNDKFKYKHEKEFYEVFLKEKETAAKTINIATQNTSNNNTAVQAPANSSNKNGSKPAAQKASNNKLNESTNKGNISMNESKVSKFNDPKKKENNTSVTSKMGKVNNAGNTNAKNLNTQRNELESSQSNKKDLISQKTKKQEEQNDEAINNDAEILNNKNILENNLINQEEKPITLNLNDPDSNDLVSKTPKNDLFSIENIQDFRAKRLDDEIKSVIAEDNNSGLNLKINKSPYQDNSTKYLIIEAVPLIIADFIHENINIAILDMSNDLRSDLRGLFDKEIIKKIEEASQFDTENERILKLKEYLFEQLNTQKNIKIYEDLFMTKRTQGENTSHLLNILEKLRNHLMRIEKKIKSLQKGDYDNNSNYDKSSTMIENLLNLDGNKFDNNIIADYNKNQKAFASKIIPKKNKTKDDLRMENFRQIFDFYAKQHQFTGKNATFEEIQEKFNIMVLAEFNKFALEFKIPLKKDIVTEIYKKNAKNGKDMHFDEFMQALEKISIRINEEKIKNNLAKIKKLRGILSSKEGSLESEKNQNQKYTLNKQTPTNNIRMRGEIEPENERIQEQDTDNNNENEGAENNGDNAIYYGNNNNLSLQNGTNINLNVNENESNNNDYANNDREVNNINELQNKNSTSDEISKTQKLIFEMKKKNNSELIADLYNLIQIDDPKSYQSKMKGFVIPFFSDKVNIRIPENSPKRAFRIDPLSQENLKKILKDRKEIKIKELEEKEKLEKLNMLEKKKIAKAINEQIKQNIVNNHDKLYSTKDKVPNKYTDIKKKHENIAKEKETKLTWDQLENLNYNHFITNRDDDFNPNDLFEQVYDSDDENIFDVVLQHTEKSSADMENKTKKSKNTDSYLNIQTNLNLINNYSPNTILNLNNSTNETIPDSIIKNYSGRTRGTSNNNYSVKSSNNENPIGIQNNSNNHLYNNNYNNQNDLKYINNRKLSGLNSPSNRNNVSAHSSHNGNKTNISNIEKENSPLHRNNKNINDNYNLQRKSPGPKSPNALNKNINGSYNIKNINNNVINSNEKNLDKKINRQNNGSAKKILNRSLEKSAGSNKNKHYRSSSKSNIYINPNQNYLGIQSPKSIKGLNSGKMNKQMYSIEKTEKMARELEKNREDQKSRIMKKHDDLVKKSIDKIKKYL